MNKCSDCVYHCSINKTVSKTMYSVLHQRDITKEIKVDVSACGFNPGYPQEIVKDRIVYKEFKTRYM
jgi:hypothetical protein